MKMKVLAPSSAPQSPTLPDVPMCAEPEVSRAPSMSSREHGAGTLATTMT